MYWQALKKSVGFRPKAKHSTVALAENIFLWVVSLSPREKSIHRPYIAITTPDSIRHGQEPFETLTRCPDEMILGRPSEPTDEEVEEFIAARKTNPDLSFDNWCSFLEPSEAQKSAFTERFNANPIRFTDEEHQLLRDLMRIIPEPHSFFKSLEIMAKARWGTPLNSIYERYFARVNTNADLQLRLPAIGYLRLSCGEAQGIAVSRVENSCLSRVIIIEETDFLVEAGVMELGPHNLLEVDESLFRPVKRHRRDWGAEVKQWWGLVGRKGSNNTANSSQMQLIFDVQP